MSATGKKILVVEDEASQRHLLTSVLTGAGYTVLCAGNAEEAHRHLRDAPEMSLVVLDLGLPGVTGLALARELKANVPHVPFFVLSGHDDPHIVKEAIASGALTYLVKPVDVRQLLPAVRAALARYDDLDSLRQPGVDVPDGHEEHRMLGIAIGLTMADRHVGPDEALALIRTLAIEAQVSVPQMARKILESRSSIDN